MNAFAYQNTSNIVEQSSSGGAFSKIVDQLSKRNPKEIIRVYGAIWNENNEVVYAGFDNKEGLKYFNKSKYSKAKLTINILKEITQDLREGKTVVFSGIPCQVNAVRQHIHKKEIDSENLFLIDIICHGAPNSKFLHDFKIYLETKYKSEIERIDFRDKRLGWRGYNTSIRFKNGRELLSTYDSNLYMRLFFSHFCVDRSCFSCQYSNMTRISDITLGDFWGIEKVMPNFPEGKGVSLILCNTDKGIELIKEIEASLNKNESLQRCYNDDFKDYQHNLNAPIEKPDNYDKFQEDYKNLPFSTLIKKYKFDESKARIRRYIKLLLIKIGILK